MPENLTAVNINIVAFCDMMLHRLTKGYQLFGGYTVSIFKVELT
jgi:hypothetical protein